MFAIQFPYAIYTLALIFTVVNKALGQNAQAIATASPCTEEIKKSNCTLPNCRCSGEDIPGNHVQSKVPQFVFLTFDDSLNNANFPLYMEILNSRKNPNGYPITATFFISHEYTNYSAVHELWRHGHEMALHSITHKPYVDYWRALNESMWHQEIVQQRLQLSTFAKIPSNEIRGMRAPFLQAGGDPMFKALHSSDGISWDCSRPSTTRLWPYTNQYASNQDCDVPPCPRGSYPGMWTVPMIHITGNNGHGCSMLDSCIPLPKTSKETFDLLHSSFIKHYEGNRAPFGIFLHSAWLNSFVSETPEIVGRWQGYIQFLDYLATLKDVYIVSISRAIEWIKSPVTVDKLKEFPPFKVESTQSKCSNSMNCFYRTSTDEERWFTSCVSECPKHYPWLGNPLGE